MALSNFALRNLSRRIFAVPLSRTVGGQPGDGVGRGGGGGGDIRSAGGAFGKMEAAREEQFFRRQQEEQISAMKRHQHEQAIYHDEEITFHEAAIKRHAEAIERHKLLKTQSEAKIRQNDEMEKQRIMQENRH